MKKSLKNKNIKAYPPVFKDKRTQALLEKREKDNPDGLDKTWVNRLMLSWNAHYTNSKILKRKARKKEGI